MVLTMALGLLAMACSSAEEPGAPQAPQPAAPAAPAMQAQAQTMQPSAPMQPAAAAPAATAVPPPGAPKAAEPIMAAQKTTSRPMMASDADTNIFSEERFGGTLVWVPQGSVGNLDSMTSGSAIGRGVSWHFWESLAQWDSQGFINPDMADNWEVDGGTYTFTLRDNLTWHDGSQVLPEDVLGVDRNGSGSRTRLSVRSSTKIWEGFETR